MWQGIYGHDQVVDFFCRSLACARLASTYLFVGPQGVGKQTFALKLAQALLCQDLDESQLLACGQCESCRLFSAGGHPDLDVIQLPRGKRWLPLELFVGDREHRNQTGLCHNIALRPRLGQRRAAIIDDADWLTVESANCLLKTLEEPPPGALIILIGSSRSRQLPTILSRSQIVQFSPLNVETTADLLLAQGVVANREDAERLAAAGEGSLQRAAELADAELWGLRERLSAQLVSRRIDVARLAADLGEVIQGAGKEADLRRRRFGQVLELAVSAYRTVLWNSVQPLPAVSETRAQIDAESALAALNRCLEAEAQLHRNANQTTLLECWLGDLADILSAAA